jgi:hypothetical protein
MTPEEILALVRQVVEMAEPYISKRGEDRFDIAPKDDMYPEYYSGYNHTLTDVERIAVHTETGVFPAKLFHDRSPNQTEEEFDYVKDNYKQTTLPVFVDYISSITRPFHKSNWSISYQPDEPQFEDDTLQAYLETGLPEYRSLEFYMRHIVPPIKTRDAEGCIAVKPLFVPTVEVEGEEQLDDMTLVEPIPQYYESEKVVSYDEGHSLILLDEKSPVKEGSRTVLKGLVFELYDENNIWKVVQVGERKEFRFEVSLYYQHNWGRLPVIKLMGIPTLSDNRIRYQSPFLYAVDNLDLVTLNQSNLQISINKCVYPIRVMLGNVCDFEDHGVSCDGGVIRYQNEEGMWSQKQCPNCNGSGLKSRLSPMGELLLKPTDRMGDGDDSAKTTLEYASPEVTTVEFLRKEIIENERRGRAILHLHDSSTDAHGQQDVTATARAIQQKDTASFVNTVSDQIFDIYAFLIDAIGWMRYGDAYKQPQLVRPTTFDYTTEADYVERIAQMTESNVPPIVVHMQMLQYLRTIYFKTEQAEKVLTLVVNADRLLGLTREDLKLKAGRGTIQPWEDVLHCSALSLVKELELENPEFLSQELTVQIEQLKAKAQSKVAQPEQDVVRGIVGEA